MPTTRKQTPPTTNPSESPAPQSELGGADAELKSSGPATASIRLPFINLQLSLPQARARLGGQASGGAPAGSAGGVERLALYGGTALLGALGVLEWPVALAAAGGTYLVSQLAGRSSGTTGAGASAAHSPHPSHDHMHGPDCGHAAIPHGDHDDYLHDGHRHAAHGDHWDEHGDGH
jgi:hypothetical protein